MRATALGHKNYLFVGSKTGGKAAAIAYTLIETAKRNTFDPHAWLVDTLAGIPDYKIAKVANCSHNVGTDSGQTRRSPFKHHVDWLPCALVSAWDKTGKLLGIPVERALLRFSRVSDPACLLSR